MSFLEKCFHLKQKGTTVKTEILAGITTFLAMAYILGVNPFILADAGMDPEAVFMATALSSAIACLLMGFIANYPVALSAGMGVNALFAYTVCGAMGYSWQAALAAVFIPVSSLLLFRLPESAKESLMPFRFSLSWQSVPASASSLRLSA